MSRGSGSRPTRPRTPPSPTRPVSVAGIPTAAETQRQGATASHRGAMTGDRPVGATRPKAHVRTCRGASATPAGRSRCLPACWLRSGANGSRARRGARRPALGTGRGAIQSAKSPQQPQHRTSLDNRHMPERAGQERCAPSAPRAPSRLQRSASMSEPAPSPEVRRLRPPPGRRLGRRRTSLRSHELHESRRCSRTALRRRRPAVGGLGVAQQPASPSRAWTGPPCVRSRRARRCRSARCSTTTRPRTRCCRPR